MFISNNIHSRIQRQIKKKLPKIHILDELNKLNVEVLSSRNMKMHIHEGTNRQGVPKNRLIFHRGHRSCWTVFLMWPCSALMSISVDGWVTNNQSVRNRLGFPAVSPGWQSKRLRVSANVPKQIPLDVHTKTSVNITKATATNLMVLVFDKLVKAHKLLQVPKRDILSEYSFFHPWMSILAKAKHLITFIIWKQTSNMLNRSYFKHVIWTLSKKKVEWNLFQSDIDSEYYNYKEKTSNIDLKV